jgi:hypothetical protein
VVGLAADWWAAHTGVAPTTLRGDPRCVSIAYQVDDRPRDLVTGRLVSHVEAAGRKPTARFFERLASFSA